MSASISSDEYVTFSTFPVPDGCPMLTVRCICSTGGCSDDITDALMRVADEEIGARVPCAVFAVQCLQLWRPLQVSTLCFTKPVQIDTKRLVTQVGAAAPLDRRITAWSRRVIGQV